LNTNDAPPSSNFHTRRFLLGSEGEISAACLNIAGLMLTLVGILLVFRYGINREKTGEEFGVVLGQKDVAGPRAEKSYDFLGWVGLMLVVLGTLFIPAFIR
jgi:hypothetical protein